MAAAATSNKKKKEPSSSTSGKKKGGGGGRSARGVAHKAGGGAPATRRQATTALQSLAKKCILDPEDETEENSLLVALLSSYKNDGDSKKKRGGGTTDGGSSIYTAGLQKIAQRVIQEYGENPSATQVNLFNLILRSVGGNTVLDPATTDLESMADKDFEKLVIQIAGEMEDLPADHTPLVANTTKLTVAQAEFRKIFEEFWYQLGKTALTYSAPTGEKNGSERFRVELARDLVQRMADLLTLWIPDIRLGLVTAIYQMGRAMLERTVELQTKLATAERQLTVAKRSRQQRKEEALEEQIESWKRTVDDIEAFATDMVVQSVVVKRYRDSCEFIRVATLEALGQFCTIRPDLYATSIYLKYFGWMLSDEVPAVRIAAIKGLLVPLEKEEAVDTEVMERILTKFVGRLTDLSTDVELEVQEAAMALLLQYLRNDFFETVVDDDIWSRINHRVLDDSTTPTVRRDALYFVLDQMEAFDSGTAKTEREAVDQLESLSHW